MALHRRGRQDVVFDDIILARLMIRYGRLRAGGVRLASAGSRVRVHGMEQVGSTSRAGRGSVDE